MPRTRNRPVVNVVLPLTVNEKLAIEYKAGSEYKTRQGWIVERVVSAVELCMVPPKIERAILGQDGTEAVFVELPQPVFDAVARLIGTTRKIRVAEFILYAIFPS